MTETAEDASVTYSVRDLLAKIHTDLTRIDTKLDTKADKADVLALDRRVSKVEAIVERGRGVALVLAAAGAASAAVLKGVLG